MPFAPAEWRGAKRAPWCLITRMVFPVEGVRSVCMLQESASTSWDMRNMTSEPSAALKMCILFLFVVCIVTSIRLISLWRTAPPFRAQRQRDNSAYLSLLQSSAASLKRWISFTCLGWGIFASISLYNLCNRLLDDKRVGGLLVVFLIREFSTTLTMALLVVLFAFLVQWHITMRMENFAKSR
jgi:hypothetical protein